MSSSSSSRRHSLLPSNATSAGPKPPVNLASLLVLPDSAVLVGRHPISLGSETVIHPRARLESNAGPLAVGRRCLVYERAVLGTEGGGGPGPHDRGDGGVTIGDYCVIEVAAMIEAGGTELGEGCIIGTAAKVGRGAILGKVRAGPPRHGGSLLTRYILLTLHP